MRLKYDPTTASVDLTVLCNQACHFCWRADEAKVARETFAAPFRWMPFDLYRRVIDALAAVETLRSVSVGGPMGEPTIVPDFATRAAYAKAAGIGKVWTNTNGVLLHKHDARALLAAFDEILVSVDAVDPALHAAVRGRAGQLPQVLANIDALMAAKRARSNRGRGAMVRVRFTENAHSAGHWPAFKAYFAGRVDGVVRRRMHSFLDALPALASDTGARLCHHPYKVVNVGYQGEVTTCCVNYERSPAFGSLASPLTPHPSPAATLKAIWEGAAFEQWRRRRMRDICKGCSGMGAAVQQTRQALTPAEKKRLRDMAALGEGRYYKREGRRQHARAAQ